MLELKQLLRCKRELMVIDQAIQSLVLQVVKKSRPGNSFLIFFNAIILEVDLSKSRELQIVVVLEFSRTLRSD